MNVQKECEGFGSHSGDRNVRAHYVIHIYQCCTEICDLKGTKCIALVFIYLEDGGSLFLPNRKFLPGCTQSQP